jgi:hypothetical protein
MRRRTLTTRTCATLSAAMVLAVGLASAPAPASAKEPPRFFHGIASRVSQGDHVWPRRTSISDVTMKRGVVGTGGATLRASGSPSFRQPR